MKTYILFFFSIFIFINGLHAQTNGTSDMPYPQFSQGESQVGKTVSRLSALEKQQLLSIDRSNQQALQAWTLNRTLGGAPSKSLDQLESNHPSIPKSQRYQAESKDLLLRSGDPVYFLNMPLYDPPEFQLLKQ